MQKHDITYNTYIEILKEELVPAMGCTEPIAIAYCGAKARDVLGCMPDKVTLYVSGNIVKNVKSVNLNDKISCADVFAPSEEAGALQKKRLRWGRRFVGDT